MNKYYVEKKNIEHFMNYVSKNKVDELMEYQSSPFMVNISFMFCS